MSAKENIFNSLKDRLLTNPINLRAVERYYQQYDSENLSQNYPAFDRSAYIDIYDIALVLPQKGSRKTFTCEVDMYLNNYITAQSLSIAGRNGIANEKAFADWELEQTIISELHDSFGGGITDIKFNKSVEYQRYDQLFVKKINFTILTCAI